MTPLVRITSSHHRIYISSGHAATAHPSRTTHRDPLNHRLTCCPSLPAPRSDANPCLSHASYVFGGRCPCHKGSPFLMYTPTATHAHSFLPPQGRRFPKSTASGTVRHGSTCYTNRTKSYRSGLTAALVTNGVMFTTLHSVLVCVYLQIPRGQPVLQGLRRHRRHPPLAGGLRRDGRV